MPHNQPTTDQILYERLLEVERRIGVIQDRVASLAERTAAVEGRMTTADKVEDRRINRKLITATYVVGLISALAVAVTFVVDVVGRILKWWI